MSGFGTELSWNVHQAAFGAAVLEAEALVVEAGQAEDSGVEEAVRMQILDGFWAEVGGVSLQMII